MATVFRVTAQNGASMGEAATMDGVVELAKDAPPGRYQIQKIHLDPATGDLRCWEWGTIIKDHGGGIKLDLALWLD